MAKETFKYTNGEVTIVWRPDLCIHSGNCARGLPSVFQPRKSRGLILTLHRQKKSWNK